MRVIILAGGSGTRLWPLSRRLYPKQFVTLAELGNRSLFQLTLERARRLVPADRITVVTSQEYYFHVLNQAQSLGITLAKDQVIGEPSAKNTLPAIALGLECASDDDEACLVLPSDHVILEEDRFAETVRNAEPAARDNVVTFGIQPTRPETGYGYIESEDALADVSRVKKFHEKPDLASAERYIAQGYFWNAGIFLLSRAVFRREIAAVNPEFSAGFYSSSVPADRYAAVKDESIDYGLLEKSPHVSVVPLRGITWSDLGSFDALGDFFDEHADAPTNVVLSNANRNFAFSERAGKVVSLVGVDDLVVVDTRDALLVARKGETQGVRAIVKALNESNHSSTEFGLTVYRPWGSYTIIDEGKGFKTKRLSVLPGKKLSSQMHYHRSEHWVVVSGTARVEIDDVPTILRTGESTYIPMGAKHRLENPGKVELHIIESQIGDYLEEDDIVRFDDEYGRK